jgi:hypothetical protein
MASKAFCRAAIISTSLWPARLSTLTIALKLTMHSNKKPTNGIVITSANPRLRPDESGFPTSRWFGKLLNINFGY